MNIYFGDCFDTSNVTNMDYMFAESKAIPKFSTANSTDGATPKVESMSHIFYKYKYKTNLDLSNYNFSNTDISWCNGSVGENNNFMNSYLCIPDDIENLNFTGVNLGSLTYLSYMFANRPALKSLSFKNVDLTNITDMKYFLSGCSNLTILDLGSSFDTSNVTNMSYMFNDCKNLTTLDLTNSNFNTSKVTDMSSMFSGCSNLTTTITILNSATLYDSIFTNSATNENAKITVNYTSDTSELTDNMINTKSSESHVEKGILVS